MNPDEAVLNFYCKRADVAMCSADTFPRVQFKPRSVQGAHDVSAAHATGGEWRCSVRAAVVHRMIIAIDMADQDVPAFDDCRKESVFRK